MMIDKPSGITLAAGMAALLLNIAGPARADASGAAVRMKQVLVPNGASMLEAKNSYQLLIPADWKIQYDLHYSGDGCVQDLARFAFRAQSPDGAFEVAEFPEVSWRTTDNELLQYLFVNNNQLPGPHCGVAGPMSAADFLRKKALPKYRPGKDVVSIEPYPDLAQTVRARMGLPARAGSTGGATGPGEPRVDAARARLRYELDGKPVEEWFTAVTVVQATPTGGVQSGQRTPMTYISHASMVFSIRAPRGQLEAQEKPFKTVMLSVQRDPQWGSNLDKYVDGIRQKLEASDIQTVNQMAIVRGQVINQIVQSSLSVSANMQAASHAGATAFDQNIRGVQSYQDPRTGKTVELSNQYGHAWRSGDQYIMSDDPDYNPNSDPNLSGNWTQMQHVDPK